MSRAPVTVPCKYKTGRVLGNGTYATVKGNKESFILYLFIKTFPFSIEAMHVSKDRII